MKKFLLYIIVLLAPALIVAQSRQLFEIDASSFTPVQTDVITGVTLDKIGLDPSRRPCARIKLHVNRMNKEDIAGISVRPIGGSVVITKQIVATKGNGLIVELTAKAPTRFYLHHDKYGDSNEVSLDLEANKEYKLEAMLNTTHSIVVRSNTKGADVYIDNIFKGRISDSYNLTVSDIHPGKHTIKVKDGSLESVKDIDVNSLNIDFLVNLESVRAQFVIFEVNPKNASVIIDGKDEFPDQYGIVQLTKNNGTYSYIVSAKDYHTERGEFTVSGSKVEKSISLRPAFGWVKVWGQGELQGANVYVDGEYIGKAPILSDKLSSGPHTIRIAKNLYKAREERIVIEDNKTLDYAPKLVADFARVTISAGEDCNIYINDKHQGKSPWRGELASGTYVFEARKNGHRSTSISKTISSTPSEQSYELPTPTPILGSIIVKSTPAMATVYIDNKQVGKTPLVQDILIGSHDITVRKEGFRDQIKNIVVSESKTTEVEFALTANQTQSASQPKTATTVSNSTANNNTTTTVSSSSTNISTNKGHVVIPNGVTEIKAEAYKGNTELKSIIIPNSVTEIQDNAFLDCKSLESITIPNSVTKIGKDAFKGCYRLKSVHISDLSAWCKIEFADILSNPLRNGTSLYLKGRLVTSLTIPTDITEIKPYAFMKCFSLTSVTIPNSVTKIGSFAFYGCRSLTSITIGNRVTSIESYAFDGCTSLTNITIPNSVTKIGSCAFYDCNKLSKVYCTPTTPPSGYYIKDMFKNNASGRVIYVPRASVRAYKKASVWSGYSNSIVGYDF